MIKIAVPLNMDITTHAHLRRAGYPPVFNDGKRTGIISGRRDTIIRLRSYDIPIEVADSSHVGLVGNDWYQEKKLELGLKLETVDEFGYGREFNSTPTLDFICGENADIHSLRDIRPGQIVITEYPHLTTEWLEQIGEKRVATYGEKGSILSTDPFKFRHELRQLGAVGLRVVHGSIAGMVEQHSGTIGVMVNETGTTLRQYGLRKIEDGNICNIKTVLVRNPARLSARKEEEVSRFCREMRLAYPGLIEGNEKRDVEGEGSVNFPQSPFGERRL